MTVSKLVKTLQSIACDDDCKNARRARRALADCGIDWEGPSVIDGLSDNSLAYASLIAGEYLNIAADMADAFRARYGVHYQGVAPGIEGFLDLGVMARMTLKECDQEMKAAGFPPRA